MPKIDSSVLHRWRIARRITLGAIVVAGTMATAGAVANRVANQPCSSGHHRYAGSYSYSGIGVELTQDGDDFVVVRVFPNTPADGKLQPGAVLLSVDGERPDDMQEWTSKIRGEQGTEVELEVAYPCSGHDTVVLERDIVRLNDEWRSRGR
jgi:C-terminal processing protease CtpA/Prc